VIFAIIKKILNKKQKTYIYIYLNKSRIIRTNKYYKKIINYKQILTYKKINRTLSTNINNHFLSYCYHDTLSVEHPLSPSTLSTNINNHLLKYHHHNLLRIEHPLNPLTLSINIDDHFLSYYCHDMLSIGHYWGPSITPRVPLDDQLLFKLDHK